MDSEARERLASSDDQTHCSASNYRKSCIGASAQVLHGPLNVTRAFFSYTVLLIAANYCFGRISAQNNFSMPSTSYNCSTNMICLGEAHVANGETNTAIQGGRLSLLSETYNTSQDMKGLAYYKEPIKMLDFSSQQPASFNTTFTIDMRWGDENGSSYIGDGMAFVISAENSSLGDSGGSFGIFENDVNYSTPFKSVVVEFDTFQNEGFPAYDISDNHVSFDFKNLAWVAAANTSDVNLTMSYQYPFYAWVEYSNATQQLEVRVSYFQSRPISPLLSYKVNLFDFLEEYMWVGFSSGAGLAFSNYYIGDWTFASWFGSGNLVPVSSPVPSSGPVPVPSPVPSWGDRSRLRLIVGISVGIPALLLAFCMAIPLFLRKPVGRRGYRRWQRRLGLIDDDDILEIEGMPERFTYKQLSQATGNFSEQSKLGQGGFGSVYRGVLPSSRTPVAVKKISSDSAQGEKEFMAEVCIISQLRHRNLIQLLGWCKDATREKYLLVYELMPNGSLDKVLFPGPIFGADPVEDDPICLSWEQRFNAVTGTAAALEYLHQGWKQQVIHRDIKSSNIMLDGDWNAKLGDFGLARLVDHQHEATTTGVAGTLGYIAPEAAVSGHFTEKTDVYAFGAVILEVACGRKVFVPYAESGEIVLVDWVWRSLSEGDLLRTVDKRLVEYDAYWMEVVLIIGLLCSHPDPLARPSMKQVVQVLDGAAPVPSIPTSKPSTPFPSATPSYRTDDLEVDLTSRTTGSKSRSASISLVSTNTTVSTPTDSNSRSGSLSLVSPKISESNPKFSSRSRGSSSKSMSVSLS